MAYSITQKQKAIDKEKCMGTLSYYKHQFVPAGEKDKCPDRVLEIYFSGCNHPEGHCPDCQNEQLWNENAEGVRYVIPETILDELSDYYDIAKQIHILGGEPLEQDLEALKRFMQLLKTKFKCPIVLFTGYNLSEMDVKRNLHGVCDYVKVGRYDKYSPNTDHHKYYVEGEPIELATTNQKIIKV